MPAQVDRIDLKPSSETAVITARVHEKGDLFATNGQKSRDHSFDSKMTVEYTVQRQFDGTLKLTNVLNLG